MLSVIYGGNVKHDGSAGGFIFCCSPPLFNLSCTNRLLHVSGPHQFTGTLVAFKFAGKPCSDANFWENPPSPVSVINVHPGQSLKIQEEVNQEISFGCCLQLFSFIMHSLREELQRDPVGYNIGWSASDNGTSHFGFTLLSTRSNNHEEAPHDKND